MKTCASSCVRLRTRARPVNLLALHYREHALAIVVPVLRCLVQAHFAEVRCPDVLVVIFLLRLADIALHLVAQHLTIRQEQGHTSRYFIAYNEQLEFATQLAVIALQRFFQTPEVLIEFLLRKPSRSIDALQHGTALVTTPVGACNLHELERANLTRILNMRSATQVKKGILLV